MSGCKNCEDGIFDNLKEQIQELENGLNALKMSMDFLAEKQKTWATKTDKILFEWKEKMEKWIEEIHQKEIAHHAEQREYSKKIFDFQINHSKAINGYLEGFNKILEEKL